MAHIEKAKNQAGQTIFPVTVADAVLMGNGKTLKGELSELGSKVDTDIVDLLNVADKIGVQTSNKDMFYGKLGKIGAWDDVIGNPLYQFRLIPVNPNDKIVVLSDKTINYSFFKSWSRPVYLPNPSANLCEGYTRITGLSGSEITAPSDAKFFYLQTMNNGKDWNPNSIKVNGVEYVGTDIDKNLEEIHLDIDEIKNTQGLFFKGDKIDVSGNEWLEGYINTDGSIVTSSSISKNFKYNSIPISVLPNTKYKCNGQFDKSLRILLVDSFGKVTDVIGEHDSILYTWDFETKQNTVGIQISYNVAREFELVYNDEVSKVESSIDRLFIDTFKEMNKEQTYKIYVPNKIYGRVRTNAKSQRFNNSIYPEGFVNETSLSILIEDGRECPIIFEEGVLSSKISVKVNDEVKDVTFAVEPLKPWEISGSAKVLCVGESTTEAMEPNPYDNEYEGAWGYPSAIQMFSDIDRSYNHGVSIMTIGHKCNKSTKYKHNGKEYSLRSFCEGYSGWPSYALLNWPCRAKLGSSTSIFSSKAMWYVLGLSSKTPRTSSVYNTSIEHWSNTPEQRELITSTPLGYYKADGDLSVWNIISTLSGTTSEGVTFPTLSSGEYTGSAEQIERINDWIVELCQNPINPFYDYSKAVKGGSAFSIDKYLERYRTCDDQGNRLQGTGGEYVTGVDGITYMIGSRVSNTSDYDVCQPTHVILNIGINDSEGSNSFSNAIANIKGLMDSINVPVGFFICRYPGVISKGLWSDNSINRTFAPLLHSVSILEGLAKVLTENQYIIDAYHIQPPNSRRGEYLETDVYRTARLNCSKNDIHTGYDAYKAIGWQCLHWIYSLMK